MIAHSIIRAQIQDKGVDYFGVNVTVNYGSVFPCVCTFKVEVASPCDHCPILSAIKLHPDIAGL